MTPADIARVAKFHAAQADCTKYTQRSFSDEVWRRHFAYDLQRIKGRYHRRYVRSQTEVDAITAFLTAEAAR